MIFRSVKEAELEHSKSKWSCFELQGTLYAESDREVKGACVGKLLVGKDAHQLQIGRYAASGVKSNYKRPIIVLKRCPNSAENHFVIAGVLRGKVAFTGRPQPHLGTSA